MLSAGLIFETASEVLKKHTRIEESLRWMCLNQALNEISEERYWSFLSENKILDFADADTDGGMYLPSNWAGVQSVWQENGCPVEFADVGHSLNDKNLERPRARWFYLSPAKDSLYVLNGSVSSDSLAISLDSPTGDLTGQFVSFKDFYGAFELASNTTLVDRWYGPNVSNENIQVRPAGTTRVGTVSADGLAYTGSLKFYGWAKHPAVYKKEQRILFPTDAAIIQLMLAKCLFLDRKERYANGYLTRYKEVELPALKRSDPMPKKSLAPKGRLGSRKGFGRVGR